MKFSEYVTLSVDEDAIRAASDLDLHASTHALIGGGIQITNYAEDMAPAFGVIKEVGEWMFSQRRVFFDKLKWQMRTEQGAFLAWPDCLLVMKPHHVNRAFLLAVLELQEQYASHSQRGKDEG